MNITRSDSEKLVIVDFPFMIGVCFVFMAGVMFYCVDGRLFEGGKSMQNWGDWMGGVVIPVVLLLAGLLLTRRTVFEFDLARRQLNWSCIGVLGPKRKTVPFSQIKGARIEIVPAGEDGFTHRIVILATERNFPVQTSGGSNEEKCRTLCSTINRALGVPDQVEDKTGETDVRHLIASGRIIEAIRLTRQMRGCSLAQAKQIVESMK